MQSFKEFLLGKRLVTEKRLPYYLNWVSRFQGFCGIKAGLSFDHSQIENFFKEMAKSHEDWQVNQAKEAVDLYRYFLKKTSGDDAPSSKESPEDWKRLGEELVRILRLKHRSLSTEKTYLWWARDFYKFLKGRHPA